MKKFATVFASLAVAVSAIFGVTFATGMSAYADEEETKEGLSAEQILHIQKNCEEIHDQLVTLQHEDSRTRVNLGRYYETILTDFIKPMNLWLVNNNLSSASLVENQNNFVARRTRFINDYIVYQKELEGLVGVDCKAEPEKFYERLSSVREKRAAVARDVVKMRELAGEQVKLVTALKEKV